MSIPDDIINKATAAALRGVMQESGLQQKSWASNSGISQTVVQKLLSGTQSVKVPQLIQLASATPFSPDEIMERIHKAVQRAVSELPVSLAEQRDKKDATKRPTRAKTPAEMSDDEIDELAGAAVQNDEHWEDEPSAP